jgi:hypothetical protein
MQGYGAQKQQERMDQKEEDKLAAYNRNVGTSLWPRRA